MSSSKIGLKILATYEKLFLTKQFRCTLEPDVASGGYKAQVAEDGPTREVALQRAITALVGRLGTGPDTDYVIARDGMILVIKGDLGAGFAVETVSPSTVREGGRVWATGYTSGFKTREDAIKGAQAMAQNYGGLAERARREELR